MQSRSANVVVSKKAADSSVEITAEIPAEHLPFFRALAVKELSGEVSIDGFRKGNVPEQILARHVGEAAILERMASIAVSEELPLIMAREKVAAIERPHVTITKLAPGNPIAFKATVAVLPEATLPDYKSLAKKHLKARSPETVSDDEVNDMTRFLRRERARIERVEAGVKPEEAHEEAQKLEEKDLPPLDEEFAKALGAESADMLTARMRENMLADKERRAQEKVRIALIEEIIEKTKLALPAVLIEHELDQMMHRLAHDIEHAGSTMEAYLKGAGKTEEDLRKEWRDAAVKRAKMHVIINEIALKEDIRPSEEDIARELAAVKMHQDQHHGQKIDETDLRLRIAEHLLPDAVFRFLESHA